MSTDEFLEEVLRSSRRLVSPSGSVLIAVSGGADSVALLHALVRVGGGAGIARLGVAHVNHGLRGAESDGDEAFVRELAATAGLPFHVTRLSGASLHDPGMEAWAREARYRFFAEVKQREGYGAIATAHTADDQAETLIMRLRRGAGIRGLAGIRERRDDGVVRPLLGVTRARIEAWLAARGLPFRTDSSNSDERLLRNRIRRRLLQELRAREPRIVEIIASCAADCAAITAMLAPRVEAWIREGVAEDRDDRLVLRKSALRRGAIAGHAVVDLLASRGCQTTRSHAAAVLASAERGSGVVLLPGGWRCEAGRDFVVISRSHTATETAEEFRVALQIPGTTSLPDGRGEITAEIVEACGKPQSFDSSNVTVMLDAALVPGPLEYRSTDSKDFFTPLGSTEPRSLRRYLKNSHIPRELRASVGVVAGESREIVWIPGVQISHGCQCTQRTRRALRLRLNRPPA